MLMDRDMLLLLGIVVLGTAAFWQDILTNRIPNAWLLIALGYAAAVHGLFLFLGNGDGVFGFRGAVNWLVSAVIAVFFWKKNWWGGGDAKLFICYAALIPPLRYGLVYFDHYFASFLLMLCTFIPATLWLFWQARHALFHVSPVAESIPGRPKRPWQEDMRVLAGFAALFFGTQLLSRGLQGFFPLVGSWAWLLYFLLSKGLRRLFRQYPFAVWVMWALAFAGAFMLPLADLEGLLVALGISVMSAVGFLLLTEHVVKVIENYVGKLRTQRMAFAGWLFLGALLVWYSRELMGWGREIGRFFL